MTPTQRAALLAAHKNGGQLCAGNRYSIRTARALERAGLATVKTTVHVWTNYRSKRSHSQFDWTLTLTPEGKQAADQPTTEDQPMAPTLQRDPHSDDYVTPDGRFTVTPLYEPSVRGGKVSRPSHWLVKDKQKPGEAETYPFLADVRKAIKAETPPARPICDGGPKPGTYPCKNNAVWKIKRTTDPDLPRMWSHACGRHLHWHAREELGGEQGRLDLVCINTDEG